MITRRAAGWSDGRQAIDYSKSVCGGNRWFFMRGKERTEREKARRMVLSWGDLHKVPESRALEFRSSRSHQHQLHSHYHMNTVIELSIVDRHVGHSLKSLES